MNVSERHLRNVAVVLPRKRLFKHLSRRRRRKLTKLLQTTLLFFLPLKLTHLLSRWAPPRQVFRGEQEAALQVTLTNMPALFSLSLSLTRTRAHTSGY